MSGLCQMAPVKVQRCSEHESGMRFTLTSCPLTLTLSERRRWRGDRIGLISVYIGAIRGCFLLVRFDRELDLLEVQHAADVVHVDDLPHGDDFGGVDDQGNVVFDGGQRAEDLANFG